MNQNGYQTSYKIEMLINQTCPSHVHNGWSQILQSTNRLGNKPRTHFFVWTQQRDRGLESKKSDQTQLNARKPGFADLYGRAEALDHMPESLPLFNNAADAIAYWAPPASPHFNINECQLLTIRHYHSARIFGAQCESQASAAPPLCENPVGEKKSHKRSSSFIMNIYARFKKLLLNQRLVNWFKMSRTNNKIRKAFCYEPVSIYTCFS